MGLQRADDVVGRASLAATGIVAVDIAVDSESDDVVAGHAAVGHMTVAVVIAGIADGRSIVAAAVVVVVA